MKWFAIFSFVLSCLIPQSVSCQDIVVSTLTSKDTILAGDRLTIAFEVKGGNISDIDTPDFSDFRVLAGPNVSSSFSMINGQMSQEASYSYILQAITVGDIKVEQVKITVGQEVFETEPVQIHVLENPDQEMMDSLQEAPSPKKKFKKKRKTYKI